MPRRVALSIAAKASALLWPALRKKSFGGRAGGTYPKIRVVPSTPTASSHPGWSPSMMASWDFLMFLPTRSSGWGSLAMMLPSRSAIKIEAVGAKPRSLRWSESHAKSRPANTTPAIHALVILEALGKMDHPLATGRIDPIISDGKPRLGHGTLEEGLVRNRRIGCRLAGAKDPAARIGRPEQSVIGETCLQFREKRAASARLPGLDGVQLGKGEKELASTFAQLADLLAELFGSLHDLLANIGLTRDAQIVFVPGLDHERRNDGKDDQDQDPSGQTDPHPGPRPRSALAFDYLGRTAASHSTNRSMSGRAKCAR